MHTWRMLFFFCIPFPALRFFLDESVSVLVALKYIFKDILIVLHHKVFYVVVIVVVALFLIFCKYFFFFALYPRLCSCWFLYYILCLPCFFSFYLLLVLYYGPFKTNKFSDILKVIRLALCFCCSFCFSYVYI